ncbi:hypothetical protein E4U11_000366 [Claviceps purpurea]|nr:hypothetical protein E4U11_000366 [Claviceps purpurea]
MAGNRGRNGGLRPSRQGVGAKKTKTANTAPVQRETDGDVQMTRANVTGVKKKKFKTTGNTSVKTGTAARWVSQEVLAERREAGQCLRCGKADIGSRITI